MTAAPFPNVQAGWAPVGRAPLADDEAAALVVHQAENRPGNAHANAYVPTNAQLAAFLAAHSGFGNADIYRHLVTGRSGLASPSTDDLFQWASAKWGIPTDWIRAQSVQESHWTQSPIKPGYGLGGFPPVNMGVYAAKYPAAFHDYIKGPDVVWLAAGVMQCNWRGGEPGDVNAGTEPLRWECTAFNVDYYAHYVRLLFDGRAPSWVPKIYKGDEWESIGGWFGGSGDAAAQKYIADVQAYLASKPWTQPGF